MTRWTEITTAVTRSTTHDEIVTVVVDDIDTAFAELTAGIDDDYDYVDTRSGLDDTPMREVWSTTLPAADGWRVHLLQRA